MTVLLTLGGVIFGGFEIPESIPFGGEQALVVHKLPGGARTIDAMGADHRDINWSGRFRGSGAQARARTLDGYRVGGRKWRLAWSTYRYEVVVRSFEADFRQPYEIPYSISCTVVSDLSAPVLLGIPGIDELIGSDLGSALGLSSLLAAPAVSSALAEAQSAASAAGTLRGADSSSIAGVLSGLAAARQAVGSALEAAGSTLESSPPISAEIAPAAMAASLAAQAAASADYESLGRLSDLIGRMGKNLAASRGWP